jgi:hypothetical protein
MNAQMNNEINNKVVLPLEEEEFHIVSITAEEQDKNDASANIYDSDDDEEYDVECTLCGSSVDCYNHNIYIVNNQKKGNEFQEDTCCESCWNNNKKMYKQEGWEGDDLDDDDEERETREEPPQDEDEEETEYYGM